MIGPKARGTELAMASLDPGASQASLAAIETSLRTGSKAIGVAAAALHAAGAMARGIKTNLLRFRDPKADHDAARRAIASLQVELVTVASKAVFDGVNLLSLEAGQGRRSYVISALTRGVGGEIKASSIEIDRDAIALFDFRATGEGPRGLLDKIDPRSGASIATLGVVAELDHARIADFLDQVDTAIAAIATAASTLSLARSRVELQASFINSIASDSAREPIVADKLDQVSAKQRAIETRALMGRHGLSIANHNTTMILELLRDD